MRQNLKKRIIPIIQVVNEKRAAVLGTGFLIKYHETTYLCTARHVLEENKYVKYCEIALPLLGPQKGIITLPCAPYLSENKESDADIGIVPLIFDNKYKEWVGAYWETFSLASFIIKEKLFENKYLIYGYPRSMQKETEPDPNIKIGVISFLTSIFSGELSSVEGFNPVIDVVLNYREEINIKGKPEKIPDLHGISGSPILCLIKHDSLVWSADKCLKIFGLEKAACLLNNPTRLT
ncbi:MAG: hypothetical protein GXP33_05280 [Spirochaetes bacterium]|nr:hypothetical protein [Spirochaetota bacterium]